MTPVADVAREEHVRALGAAVALREGVRGAGPRPHQPGALRVAAQGRVEVHVVAADPVEDDGVPDGGLEALRALVGEDPVVDVDLPRAGIGGARKGRGGLADGVGVLHASGRVGARRALAGRRPVAAALAGRGRGRALHLDLREGAAVVDPGPICGVRAGREEGHAPALLGGRAHPHGDDGSRVRHGDVGHDLGVARVAVAGHQDLGHVAAHWTGGGEMAGAERVSTRDMWRWRADRGPSSGRCRVQ